MTNKEPTPVRCPVCGAVMRVSCVQYDTGNIGWLYWCTAQSTAVEVDGAPQVTVRFIPHAPLP